MVETTGILFALLAMIFWGVEEFFLKEAIRGLKSLTAFIINTLASAAVIFLAVFFLFPERVSLISFEHIPLLAVIAVIGFFASLLSIILARVYLGERMTPKEIVGACFILLGVVTLSVWT
ncbi:MAG: EamA family transporter [Candidatus Portnoybacteria bacterium]|nr:EamA family transporter [Candidatus Portnoybacteria bacterium]